MGERSTLSEKDFAALRGKHATASEPTGLPSTEPWLDGDELSGFGMTAERQVMHRKHRTPEWFANKSQRDEFLRNRFPFANQRDGKCSCERCVFPERGFKSALRCKCRPCRETIMAGKWRLVMRLWFLGHNNDDEIEEIYGWKSGTVGSIVQKIRRAVAGARLDGKPRTGKPRGRPKSVSEQPLREFGVSDLLNLNKLNPKNVIPDNGHNSYRGRDHLLPTLT
jgi:hypothetical protein